MDSVPSFQQTYWPAIYFKLLVKCFVFWVQLYDPTLTMRLGITTGICLHMKNYPGRGAPELHQLPFFTPDHYETIMSWYFGDMGHICGMVCMNSLIHRVPSLLEPLTS